MRLTQRVVAALQAPTGEGSLYQVDLRLRPSGNAGPLAQKLRAFRRYHAHSAWTWEHMALTRARVVLGARAFVREIEETIRGIQTIERDPDDAAARRACDAPAPGARQAAEGTLGREDDPRADWSTASSLRSTWSCATPPGIPRSSAAARTRCWNDSERWA